MQLPIKQVKPISFINSHFLWGKKSRAATICIPHLAAAILPENTIVLGVKYNNSACLINHQVISADNPKYTIAQMIFFKFWYLTYFELPNILVCVVTKYCVINLVLLFTTV